MDGIKTGGADSGWIGARYRQRRDGQEEVERSQKRWKGGRLEVYGGWT